MGYRYEWDFTTEEVRSILWLLKNSEPGKRLKAPTVHRWRNKRKRITHALKNAQEVE